MHNAIAVVMYEYCKFTLFLRRTGCCTVFAAVAAMVCKGAGFCCSALTCASDSAIRAVWSTLFSCSSSSGCWLSESLPRSGSISSAAIPSSDDNISCYTRRREGGRGNSVICCSVLIYTVSILQSFAQIGCKELTTNDKKYSRLGM